MSNLIIDRDLNGKLLEYVHYVYREGEKSAICIDPGYDTERIFRYIDNKGIVIDNILLTHGHFDHMLSCKALQDRFNSNIYISKIDEEILYNADNNYAILIHKNEIDKFTVKNIADGDVLNILGLDIKCISTPGHTKGGISFYIESEKVLFSGDTLFFETHGRTDLYSSSFEDIKNSIVNKLFLLDDDVKVFPGHGKETTIGYEKINNDILR